MNSHIKQYQKIISQLRPDSPKTQLACNQLGIKLEQIQIKQPQDFGESGVSEGIQNIRYEHHLRRLHQFAIEILERRKFITIKKRQKTEDKMQSSITYSDDENVPLPEMRLEKKQLASTLSNPKKILIKDMMQTCQTTINYFKQALEKPEIKQVNEIFMTHQENSKKSLKNQHDQDISNSDLSQIITFQEHKNFHEKISKDIQQYNKFKQQRFRKAQIELNYDIKQAEQIGKQKQKEKQVLENALGEKLKKIAVLDQLRKNRLQRLSLVESSQNEFRRKKIEDLQKIHQRFEQADKILQKQNEEKESEREKKIRQHEEQRMKIRAQKAQIEQQQEEYESKIINTLKNKQENCEKKIQNWKLSTQQRLRENYEKLRQSHHESNQKFLETSEKKVIQQVVSRLDRENSQILENLKQKVDDIKIKKQKRLKQFKQIGESRLKSVEMEKRRIQEIVENEQTKSSFVFKIKNQTNENGILRQEINNLRKSDIQENYERMERVQEKQIGKIAEKDKQLKETKILKNFANQYLRDTVMENFKHQKEVSQMVFKSVRDISDTLYIQQFPWTTKPLSQPQKRRNYNLAKGIYSEKEVEDKFPLFFIAKKKLSNQIIQNNSKKII